MLEPRGGSRQVVWHGPSVLVRHPLYLVRQLAALGGLLIFRTWTLAGFELSKAHQMSGYSHLFRASRTTRVADMQNLSDVESAESVQASA